MEESQTAPDGERLSPSEKTVRQIARREGVAPVDLTPLHEVVDPDALDQLFEPAGSSTRMAGAVTFEYHGYEVTVHADGFVEITPRDA